MFDGIEYVIGLVDLLWGVCCVVVGYLVLFLFKYVGIGNENYGLDYDVCYKLFYDVIKVCYF